VGSGQPETVVLVVVAGAGGFVYRQQAHGKFSAPIKGVPPWDGYPSEF
jgi:hypothetical protein